MSDTFKLSMQVDELKQIIKELQNDIYYLKNRINDIDHTPTYDQTDIY